MEKTLLSREVLADRWGYDVSTICRLEQKGVIHRVKDMSGVRYSLFEIEQIERYGLETFNEITLLDYKKMENERDKWKNEYLKLRNAISASANDLVKVLSEGVEIWG